MVISHSTVHIPNDIVKSADWNANHIGKLNHLTDLTNIGVNTHAQIDTHLVDSSDPHGATLTQTNIICAGDITGGDTLTIVAGDHGAAATDEVVNVSYGTGDPPDPATMTEGALWVKYTA